MKETPKQRLRGMLDRLKITDEQRRELDKVIEEASDEEAETLLEYLDDMEADSPGAIEEMIRTINENGIPDE